MAFKTPYTDLLRELAPEHDPRHVEAYIRVAHPTMGHLSRAQLRGETRIAVECIRIGGKDAAEAAAKSFGL